MSQRLHYLLGFLIVLGLLGVSLYLQFYKGVEPCPLCSLQRLSFVGLGLFFLIGIFCATYKVLRHSVNFLLSLFALLGAGFAARQVWIQNFPSANANECGVSLQYMMQVLPLGELIQKIFEGTAECARESWHFLSLNMAEWSLIWFVLLLVYIFYFWAKRTV